MMVIVTKCCLVGACSTPKIRTKLLAAWHVGHWAIVHGWRGNLVPS